jgi:hypothetical protein
MERYIPPFHPYFLPSSFLASKERKVTITLESHPHHILPCHTLAERRVPCPPHAVFSLLLGVSETTILAFCRLIASDDNSNSRHARLLLCCSLSLHTPWKATLLATISNLPRVIPTNRIVFVAGIYCSRRRGDMKTVMDFSK